MSEPSKHSEESTLQISLPDAPTIGVFCTSNKQGLQNRVFLVLSLSHVQKHNDLSWFRPSYGGNSPTSNDLVLMKICVTEGKQRAQLVHVRRGSGSCTAT
jgi:hypothetical protein